MEFTTQQGTRNKLSEKEIFMLISLRNNSKYSKLFDESEGKKLKRSKMWAELSAEISEDLCPNTVRKKYNCLFSEFKKEKFESSRTGAAPSKWKYFKIFNEHFNNSRILFMPGVEELGDPKSSVPSYSESEDFQDSLSNDKSEPKRKRISTRYTKNEMLEAQMGALQAITKLAKKQLDEAKTSELLSVEVKQLRDDLSDQKNLLQKISEMLNDRNRIDQDK